MLTQHVFSIIGCIASLISTGAALALYILNSKLSNNAGLVSWLAVSVGAFIGLLIYTLATRFKHSNHFLNEEEQTEMGLLPAISYPDMPAAPSQTHWPNRYAGNPPITAQSSSDPFNANLNAYLAAPTQSHSGPVMGVQRGLASESASIYSGADEEIAEIRTASVVSLRLVGIGEVRRS